MRNLASLPVTQLKGVGSQLATLLARIGLESVQDVLFHLPLRYEDRTRITPIGALQPNVTVLVEGEIRGSDVVFGRRRSLVSRLQDGTGQITLRLFHFHQGHKLNLKAGTRIRCFGEVRRGASGLEMYHPEIEYLTAHEPAETEHALTPVYPATEGITQNRLRTLTSQALALLDQGYLEELLPEPQGSHRLELATALRLLHRPPIDMPLAQLNDGDHPAQTRLILEELVAHHVSLLRVRQRFRQQRAPALPANPALLQQFLKALPFDLTPAQQKVNAELAEDLAAPQPMLRLVQGDVGSGKTVVAACAALCAIGHGYQVALMAPTEILAEQHHDAFRQWLTPLGIEVALLTGRTKGKARDHMLQLIGTGQAAMVVGTHALFQDEVVFEQLGLAIIDEQHRFGVHQRLALREKGRDGTVTPHQLIMTATPIPRTLAMSAYADLDCSVIDELPPGRQPVNTAVISNLRRGDVIERVRQGCRDGRQAYWVCTLVEESELLEAAAAEATAAELQLVLTELRIGLIHGRLKPREKAEVMATFKAGKLDLLVATTVIEVGVDVPNASLMIIENPERLGLAQLHQLRGRVGRGAIESHCVLLFGTPLSQHGRERLAVMRETCDGFRIAEKDLELRGPGEVLGTRQTGELRFRIADLQRDAHLLEPVRELAQRLIVDHPDQVEALIQRWVPRGEEFAQA